MYNIHDSTVYLYFFIILANKVACLLDIGEKELLGCNGFTFTNATAKCVKSFVAVPQTSLGSA